MRRWIFAFLILLPAVGRSDLPDLTPGKVLDTTNEILAAHASYHELSPEIVKRVMRNYIEELDPTKTYFIAPCIQQWLEPCDSCVNQVLTDFKNANFQIFSEIYDCMLEAIAFRHQLEQQIDINNLPNDVTPEEFKDMEWVKNEQELLERLRRIKALQIKTAAKLNDELKEKSLQRIAKRQAKYEEELLTPDHHDRQKLMLADVLKATASSLDTHTRYFTPEEASQFLIDVQQRLFGIGAQLRDDLNGFSIVKIIEGGPAANGGQLQVKDRIIAVDGEPVVGMDITDAVQLIRGEENTPVVLTVIREVGEGDNVKEEKLDIPVMRGEVVIKETRYESSYEPFGDGVIGYLRLFTFYQDPEYSSATDLANEIEKLKKEHNLKGVILDLRNNTGGLLSQAVSVTGLFITKGIVVSIKDNSEKVQHLRDLDGKSEWSGPLIVLVNRASASASEIVAQTLQDYGRAIIVGDDHTFGKGSFQTFTLNSTKSGAVNPAGEYKVTRGRYYTVSGKTPQLTGVLSDVTIPGPLSEIEIGEQYAKYPLDNATIKPNYDDDLSDVPYMQREKIRMLYKFDLQKQMDKYNTHIGQLKKNSEFRQQKNANYQAFLAELKKKDHSIEEPLLSDDAKKHDYQLEEAENIMKDLIILDDKDSRAQGA
ncbi:MAG: PDZ domain-containing protein [Chlamydiales bacterium]|nr:PDZ domain-containing protein [Chlamydiia bacterium]MCP5507724.1 PDZ domain-containing protein [Chlamydiales bacterium]